MDALFQPLASAVGASVDQIKVSFQAAFCINNREEYLLTCWPTAHIMSTNCIPTGQSVRPDTFDKPKTASLVQHFRRHSVLLPCSTDIFCVLPTTRQYHGHVSHREVLQEPKYALGCFCVCVSTRL